MGGGGRAVGRSKTPKGVGGLNGTGFAAFKVHDF